MKSASELLQQFTRQHDGKIPTTDVNWSSDNSDISFIWTFNFLGVLDLWHAVPTADEKQHCLAILQDTVRWVFTQTDVALGSGHWADVTKYQPSERVEKMSLGMGYARSPSNQLNPGWSRYREEFDGFRPEILASGIVGYAIASFIRDCYDTHQDTEVRTWLLRLKDIFQYHNPNWRELHIHSPGKLYDDPPNAGIAVSGYWWPKASNDGAVYPTMPGLNQQVQFLCMGALTEELLGESFGAMGKLRRFVSDTLPFYLRRQGHGLFTLYDLRDNPNERANDTTHHQHSMPLWVHGMRWGLIPRSDQAAIIRQVKSCHKVDGKFSILIDRSDFHNGRDRETHKDDHPDAAMWADCLLFEGGHELLYLAEQTIEHQMPDAWTHKDFHYHARFLRRKMGTRQSHRPEEPSALPITPDPPMMSGSQPSDVISEGTEIGNKLKKSPRKSGKTSGLLMVLLICAVTALVISKLQ